LKEFFKLLKITNLPSKQQTKNEMWDVEGILYNQKYKFDLRPIKNNCKIGFFKSKADKIVFDFKDQWIIVDSEELHKYLKEDKIKEIHLNKLLPNLYWTLIIPKKG